MTIRVGLNGFGRIGRTILRACLDSKNKDFDVVHINDLTDTGTLAHLLKYDSVHGTLDKNVYSDSESLVVDGQQISVSAIKSPEEITWKNVDVIFECTGLFTKREQADRHKKAGVDHILISAPASGEDLTVVMGVNDEKLKKGKHKVVSNGSCTTNCLAPVGKVIRNHFGIEHALMTTIHAYTNDQHLLDLPHKDLRRARAGALSMIPTSTGAAKAIGLVIPELMGKVDGMAIRVPTPNVSLVDVTFRTTKPTTAQEVNDALREASQGPLKGILGYSEEPLVSIDYNGSTLSSCVDALNTKVIDGRMVKVLSWYDNETGFSWRMLDVARLMV